MKKLLLLFSLFIFSSTAIHAQVCDILIPICDSQDGLELNAVDPSPITIDTGCQILQGTRTLWFRLAIIQPTDFTFQIEPTGDVDYDFAVWVNADCNNLGIADRASYDAPGLGEYDTGLNLTATDFCETAIGDGQVQFLSLVPGDEVIIVVDRFTETPDIFDLTFGDPDAFDCSIVDDCTVEINEGDQILCDVPEFQLTTTISGPVESYEWYKDGVLIPGETNDNLSVTETGNYEVIANGTECTVPVSDDVNITLLFGGGCTVEPECSGVDFEENFGTGTGRVSTPYTNYTFNGTTQVEDGEYTITNTSAGLNTGWFQDMEDHTEGDVDGRMLFVNASFDPDEFYRRTITLDANTDYTFNAWITTVYDTNTNICGGNSIPSNVIFRIEDPSGTLIAETNTGDIPNGTAPNWQEFAIAFNTGANTDIQLVLINNSIGGCGNDLAIDDITLSLENQQPQIVAPPDLEACDVDGNGEEVFNLEDQTPIILDGQDPALFNVSFHHSQFEAEANNNPIVNPDAYTNMSNPETIYVRVEKVAEPSCFNTVSFQLFLGENIDLSGNLPAEVVLCLGDDFPPLDATPSDPNIDLTLVTYEWRDGTGTIVSTDAIYTPTAGGTYTVTVTYPPCSEQTFTVEVIVNDPPSLDLGEDQILCDGSSYEIVPTIVGDTEGITYLWSTGETTPTITVTESGTYSLEITVGPCTVSDSIDISISDPVIVDLGGDFESCFEQDTFLTATVTGDPQNATYTWYLDGVLINGETDATLQITEEGEYTVIVTVDSCTGEDTVVVSTRQDIEVSIGEDFQTCPNETQTLTAVTSEENATYQWFLNGDIIPGETGSTLDFQIESGTMGTQTYSVVITIGSCTATDSADITLYAVGNCVISEGLSPNGDGYNDNLDLTFLSDRSGSLKLEIFNRLGTKVFEQNNYTNQWHGQTNDGDELPTGTYFYVLDIPGNDSVYGQQATGWIYLNQEAN